MQTLSPRAVTAIVLAPFAILALEWALREPPPGAWLVAALAWWWQGASSPLSWWALVSYVLLIPCVVAVPALVMAIVVRRSWMLVRVLAWLSAIVLVPGLVVVVEAGAASISPADASLDPWRSTRRRSRRPSRSRRRHSRTRTTTACSRPTPSGCSSGCR